MNSNPTTKTSIIPGQKTQEISKNWELDPEHEFRFEVDFNTTVKLKLLSGTAEIYGTEIAVGLEYEFTGRKVAVFTWHGSLEQCREEAKEKNEQGPRVIIVGPEDVGKTSLSKILLSYAFRLGRQPIYVDLDGSITMPGTLSATPITHLLDVEEGFGSSSTTAPTIGSSMIPIVYYYGYPDPGENVKLYKVLTSKLANSIKKRLEKDEYARISGLVIDTNGLIDNTGYDIIQHCVDAFDVNIIIVLGHERLYSDMARLYSDHSKIHVLKLAKSGGVVYQDKGFRRQVQMRKIREYFYGLPKVELSPCSTLINLNDVTIFRVGVGSLAPPSALPIGFDRRVSETQLVKVEPDDTLRHSILAITASNSSDEIEILESSIIGHESYMKQLLNLRISGSNTLYVDFKELYSYNSSLGLGISKQYYRIEPYLRKSVEILMDFHYPKESMQPNNNNGNNDIINNINAQDDDTNIMETAPLPAITELDNTISNTQQNNNQSVTNELDTLEKSFSLKYSVAFYNPLLINRIREIKSLEIGTLIAICGTVTRTSEVRPELLFGNFTCPECKTEVTNVEQQFRYTEPSLCKTPTCSNRNKWILNIDKSDFTDWQRIRIQENPNEIPTGSMPRTIEIIVRGEMVDRAKPGNKCVFVGTPLAIPDINQLGVPGSGTEIERNNHNVHSKMFDGIASEGVTGIKALGARDLSYKISFLACNVYLFDAKFDNFILGKVDNDIIEEESRGITEIFTADEMSQLETMGKDSDIVNKLVQSIAPTVFGHEIIKKGILLQLLGGVHKVTPEGINLRGDINICIVGDPSTSKSQFLKYAQTMSPRSVYTSGKSSTAAGLTAAVVKDEESGDFTIEAVAIHEAMEQQTISIAKAGIHASLNARTSILAAANPIGGRYNRRLTLRQNIAMSAPIMSRFDLFFVVIDECKPNVDNMIANHIIKTHRYGDDAINPCFTTTQLQQYIKYAKGLKPQISHEAGKLLVKRYKELRTDDASGVNQNSYRITVRQLESMIRLSEAIAKAHCAQEISPEYVDEAYNLLKESIIHIYHDDLVLEYFETDDIDNTQRTIMSTQNDSVMDLDVDTTNNDELMISRGESSSSVVTRRQLSVSHREYTQTRDMIIAKIRSFDTKSCTEQDLSQWYLEYRQEKAAINSAEGIALEEKKIKCFIQKMEKENWIIKIPILEDDEDEQMQDNVIENPTIKYMVHPNLVDNNV
ncbi:11102_t:CDS:10 [Entrophospora sp. SA101]|nr:11102_t:CDS:10 [Entrophospora sp. SA101]